MALSLAADLAKRRAPELARLRAKSAGGAAGAERSEQHFRLHDDDRRAARAEDHLLSQGRVSAPQYDETYSLEEAPVASLLREIHARGHELGLHPSYTRIATARG